MSDWSLDAEPVFLDKEQAEALPYPGVTIKPNFDHELEEDPDNPDSPSRGYITRWKEVARLHSLGKTNNDICEILGYTATRVSILLTKPFVQREIERYRQLFFDGDVVEKVKEMARDGLNVMHAQILDPSQKPELRSSNARWAAEMSHGKAKTSLDVQSSTLQNFMDMLKQAEQRGEPLDVTPQLPEARSAEAPKQAEPVGAKWEAWITENLP